MLPPPPQAPHPPPTPARGRYPLEAADRPLTNPPGVTELDLSFQYRSRVDTTDATNRISNGTIGLSLEHAFGPVDIGLGLGQLAYGWIALDTHASPSRFQVTFGASAFQPDARYFRIESVSAMHKTIIVPHSFAVSWSVQLDLVQAGTVSSGTVNETQVVATGASLGGTIQLLEPIAFSASIGASIPLAQTLDAGATPTLIAGGHLLFAVHAADLVVGLTSEVAGSPAVLGSIGMAKRWGL